MSKEIKIENLLKEKITTPDLQEKYLELVKDRIIENKSSISKLYLVMIFAVVAFPLIIHTKITEISIGPLSINDSNIAISLIPTIFAFTYYKFMTIWLELVEQKMAYNSLTSEYFKVEADSYLNKIIKPYSFTDSVSKNHFKEKSKYLGCLVSLLWIPIALSTIIFPFGFEFYSVRVLVIKNGLSTFLDWVFFLTPVILGLLTILIVIQVAKKDMEK